MVENADGSNNLSNAFYVSRLLFDVGWIHDYKRSSSNFISCFDSDYFTILAKDNFINILVEHVSSTMDSAVPSETFRNSSKTIDGIKEGMISISANRIHVQLDLLNTIDGWFIEILIICVEGDGMTDEVDGVVFK